jgi:hypothetical protein
METTITANAELIEGMFFGFFFALCYYAPSILRRIPGNNAACATSNVYTNENGSACSKGSF